MHGVKDELQMFIDSQKQKLNQDKRDLGKAKKAYISPRQDNQDEDVQRERYSRKDVDGLVIGDYEKKQRQYKEERIQDYKRYAAEKEFRRTGKQQALNDENSHRDTFNDRREVTTPDIVDAYAELLRKKRAEEKSYRGGFDDEPVNADRKVRFNESRGEQQRQAGYDEEDELFQWARDKAKLPDRRQSARTSRTEKSQEVVENENKRAKSVPPVVTAAGIFGGGENNNDKSKKEKYKQELQLQIKEKEEQKLREKLKRMGRLSSAEVSPRQKDNESKKQVKNTSPRISTDDDISTQSRRTPDRSSRRKQQQRQYDDDYDNRIEPPFDERFRGRPLYRNMPPYDPMMQMMQQGMVDPYYMQRGLYGGFPAAGGYPGNGGFPGYQGAGGMGVGGNPMLMNQMQGMQNFQGVKFDDRISDGNRRQTPRSPRSRDSHRDAVDVSSQKKKKFVSPRDKVTAGLFGHDENAEHESGRAAKIAYQKELQKQMQEKKEAKEKDKKERERYEAKIEAEIAAYDPWGKGGAGAPMKDQKGKLVADLRTMHKFNDEGKVVLSPREDATNHGLLSNLSSSLPEDSPVLAALGKLVGEGAFEDIQNNQAQISARDPSQKVTGVRGAALKEIQGQTKTVSQKTEQMDYQNSLKQQIEEKKRLKLEQERKEKEEEEKENLRLEQQRLKLEKDFLEEQERERRKEEETRKQNDDMRKAAEQKRQEAQKYLKQIEEDRTEPIQKSSSELESVSTRHREATLPEFKNQVVENIRSNSPPIPTIAHKQQNTNNHRVQTPRRQDISERRTSAGSRGQARQQHKEYTEVNIQQQQQQHSRRQAEQDDDEDRRYLNSIRQQLYERTGSASDSATNSGNQVTSSNEAHVIRQLAALRRQLSTEEKKVQQDLERNMGKYEETKTKNSPRRTKGTNMEIFEKARIRRGSASKKPSPKVADDFTKLTDTSSVMDFKSKFPSKPVTSSDLDLQQREFIRLQEQKLQALRQAISDTSDHLMLEIDKQDKPPTPKVRKPSKQSLLESESKFINFGDQNDAESQSRQESARSRRRSNIKEEDENFQPTKPKSPGGYSVASMTSQAIEDIAAKNEARLKRLRGENNSKNNETDDPEDVLNDYMNDKR